ncbi:MAG: hypothetical protein F4W90_05935 [Gammaproteobacteria bacterium]|nr:hypothetical protein [Gammaproteobacteria bacterium]
MPDWINTEVNDAIAKVAKEMRETIKILNNSTFSTEIVGWMPTVSQMIQNLYIDYKIDINEIPMKYRVQ